MKILAIETSCDDTAISILNIKKPASQQGGSGTKDIFTILANKTNSQINIHVPYGGVFPALAKREHQKNLPIVFEKTLSEAKITIEKIDLITVTYGPGLEPALWTGIVFAKELSEKYKIPIIPVNHMEGHIFSIFPKNGKTFTINSNKKIFPMLSLLVSGGHTELILIKDWLKYKKIGQTRDDAAGEAFDKVARMMGLPYPGGPEIGKLAEKERSELIGIKRKCIVPGSLAQAVEPSRAKTQQSFMCADGNNTLSEMPTIHLPRPMIYSNDYDFSFSGLKTAVLYLIRDLKEKDPNILEDIKIKQIIAKEFEDACFEVLSHKTIKAIKQYKIKTLIVGGGVSAAPQLKKVIEENLKKNKLKIKTHFPGKGLTGDNAIMIGVAGYFQYKKKKTPKNINLIKAKGNLSL